MKKTLFITVQKIIDQGGISASIQNLLNEIYDKYDITLCPIEDYISPSASIPSNIRICRGSSFIGDAVLDDRLLAHQSFLRKLPRYGARILRRFLGTGIIIKLGIKQIKVPREVFDAAIAFSGDLYCNGRITRGGEYQLVSKIVDAKQKVAWVHNDIRKLGFNHDICLKAFRQFDSIVSVSYDNKAILDEMVPEYKYKSFVVYNTYNLERIVKMGNNGANPYEDNGRIHFVTVARLSIKQKRQDRIIKASGRLKREGFLNFDWYLVGGGERDVLEQMVKDNDVSDIIHFTGQQSNPYPYMKHADAFVLTSLYEGYGMTNKEAQVLGVPTLITNYSAAKEVVEVGKQGYICENSSEGVYQMVKHVLQHTGELDVYRKYLKEHPVTNELAIKQFCIVCGFN